MKRKELLQKLNVTENKNTVINQLLRYNYIKRLGYDNYEIEQNVDISTLMSDLKKSIKSDRTKNAKRRMSPEVRQKISASTKIAMNRPEVREKFITNLSTAMRRPETRERLSEATKRLWQQQDYRQIQFEKKSEYLKNKWQDKSYRETQCAKVSKKMKENWQNKEFRESRVQALRREETKQKIYKTKKENHSFNSSKAEKYILQQLLEIFPDTKCQYYSEKYPFNCDFYIPSLDLYIECHFNWTHGGRPFDKNDKSCIEQLNTWKEKAKTSKFYQNAIETWTVRDVEKFKYATSNNLKWLVFYNWQQYEQWLNKRR